MTHAHTYAPPRILSLSTPTPTGAYRVVVTWGCATCAYYDEYVYDTTITGRFRDQAGMLAVHRASQRGRRLL